MKHENRLLKISSSLLMSFGQALENFMLSKNEPIYTRSLGFELVTRTYDLRWKMKKGKEKK